MKHIMVDLETLDTKPTAAFFSIGAIKFDLEKGELSNNEFYRLIRVQSCISLGLTVNGSTLAFWADQSAEARKALIEQDLNGWDLIRVLTEFSQWAIDGTTEVYLWGNGSTFDNSILANAYRACGLFYRYPVSYKHDLCYRTIRQMYKLRFPERELPKFQPHIAIEDARFQAAQLISMWKEMK